MREVLILAIHLLFTVANLTRPGGPRAVAAESLLLKHQLLISNRSRQRAPNLTALDRFLLGLTTLFISPRRIPKLSAIVKPVTLLKFHKALNTCYRVAHTTHSTGMPDCSPAFICATTSRRRSAGFRMRRAAPPTSTR